MSRPPLWVSKVRSSCRSRSRGCHWWAYGGVRAHLFLFSCRSSCASPPAVRGCDLLADGFSCVHLPLPQPLHGDAELAEQFGDPVPDAPVLIHDPTVNVAGRGDNRNLLGKTFPGLGLWHSNHRYYAMNAP